MGAACCGAQPNRNNQRPKPNPPQPESDNRAVDLLKTQKIQEDEERKKKEAERLRQEEQDRLQREEEERKKRLAAEMEEEERKKRLAAEMEEEERKKRLGAEMEEEERKRLAAEEERKRKEKEERDRLQAEINRQLDLFQSQLKNDINRDLNLEQSDIQVTKTAEMSYEFDQNELLGPILIQNMNFSVDSNDNFQEIQGKIEILKYLQPGTNSTNSFIIQYQNNKYFMKTFYSMQKTSCSEILQEIKEFQHKYKQNQQTSQALAKALKYLCYFHREVTDQAHYTMSLISTVEQYNLYTFAADESIPLDIKIQVATEIMQIGRWIVCNDTMVKLDFDLKFLKPSNILISVQNNKAKVSFSDWYYQLKSFNKVINREDSFDPRYSSNIVSNYEESGQVLQSNAQQDKKEMSPEQEASFKLLLVLIFYNLDLSSDDPMGLLNGYNDLNLRVDNEKKLEQLFKSDQLQDYISKTIAQKQRQDQNKYNEIWNNLLTKGVEGFYGIYHV